MESFVWGDHFITGLVDVDDQHRDLIRILNQFGTSLAENRMVDEFVHEIFKELAEYAAYHFQEEERLMLEMSVDPRHTDTHFDEHQSFLNDVTNLYQSIETDQPETQEALLEFLIQWVAYHILGSDQTMTKQIMSIRQGISPAEAFLAVDKTTDTSTSALLTALNNLYQQVARRNRELIELTHSLEKKVHERTEKLNKLTEHFKALSYTDPLTGLHNRRFAMDLLQQLWEDWEEQRITFSCMMIDVDKFKDINDSFGHVIGDEILQKIARELQHSVRSDDVVCRLGGDEFFIICPHTSFDGAFNVANLAKTKVKELQAKKGETVWKGSISIGIASSSPAVEDINHLLRKADAAVYSAKYDGRDCIRGKS